MYALLRGFARPGGRPGGIIVKASRIDFAREPGEPENFKNLEFFEGFSEVAEELRVGKIEWEHVVGTVRVMGVSQIQQKKWNESVRISLYGEGTVDWGLGR